MHCIVHFLSTVSWTSACEHQGHKAAQLLAFCARCWALCWAVKHGDMPASVKVLSLAARIAPCKVKCSQKEVCLQVNQQVCSRPEATRTVSGFPKILVLAKTISGGLTVTTQVNILSSPSTWRLHLLGTGLGGCIFLMLVHVYINLLENLANASFFSWFFCRKTLCPMVFVHFQFSMLLPLLLMCSPSCTRGHQVSKLSAARGTAGRFPAVVLLHSLWITVFHQCAFR